MNVINILYDFCFMAALLFVGKIIRAKFGFIQKLYIPSALIAGFLGLILGHQFLNIIPFSNEISFYSGILISVLFGSMFLGTKRNVSFTKMISSVGDTFLVNGASEIAQFGIFIFIGVTVLPNIFIELNNAFGLMLPAGFVGGHGTAAAIGSVLAEAGWDEAISIGQTFATIGLLGGIIIGISMINIGVRKGYTKIIKNIKDIPEDMRTGLIPAYKRTSFGDNTVNAMSIDPLTWHACLILIAVGGAYFVNNGLKILFPQISFPVYGLALLCSIFIQKILGYLKVDEYIDKKIIIHIGSSATDFLVAFGVAAINVSIVLKYAIPITILLILGFVLVIGWFLLVSPRFFKTYWFERGIYIFGMSTGVLATGVILLRIADPKFESGVLEDFGFAWIFLSIIDMLLVSFSPLFVLQGYGLLYSSVLIFISIVFLVICKFFIKKG